MSSVQPMLTLLKPIEKEVRAREENGKSKSIDARISKLRKKIEDSQLMTWRELEIKNITLSSALSLADLNAIHQTSEALTAVVVSYLDLQKQMDCFPGLLKRIGAVSERVLDLVTLFDLQKVGSRVSPENSAVWFAVSSDEQFLDRKVSQMKKVHFKSSVALTRIREMKFDPKKQLGLRVRDLRFLTAIELSQKAKSIPGGACSLLKIGQIVQLDFTRFNGVQLDAMMRQDCIGLLKQTQVNEWVKKSYSDSVRLLSEEQIKNLDYEGIKDFGQLFSGKGKEARIQAIPLEFIDRMSGDLFQYLSDEQYASLDPSKLSEKQLRVIFPGFTQSTLHEGVVYQKEGNFYTFKRKSLSGRISEEYFLEKLEKNKNRCLY